MCLCKHITITKEENTFYCFDFLRMSNNHFFNFNSDTVNKAHPIRIVGKTMFKFCDLVVREFLEKIVYSRKHLQKIKYFSNELEAFINGLTGLFKIGIMDNMNNEKLLKFGGKNVQFLVWICPWANAFLKMHHGYFQIDASFYALKPYTYSIPLLIVDNAPIPIGIVVGPSEHQNLFNTFFEFLIEKYDLIEVINFPILSDEGKAIDAFSRNYGFPHFFCFRHLIEKMGSGSIMGTITRRLLYQTNKSNFKTELEQAISDIYIYFKKGLIDLNSIYKFRNIFELYSFAYLLIPTKEPDHMHGIWNRINNVVSTCSNHVERLHRTMNEAVSNTKSIERRIQTVMIKIIDYYKCFEKIQDGKLENYYHSSKIPQQN